MAVSAASQHFGMVETTLLRKTISRGPTAEDYNHLKQPTHSKLNTHTNPNDVQAKMDHKNKPLPLFFFASLRLRG
jgi:hypothetical protein